MMASEWLKNHFFSWFTGWRSYGYVPTIGTIRDSVLVTVFNCGFFFHLGSFLVHLLEFLLACLPGWHPRRYCWGVSFLNILARVFNNSFCPCPNFTKGIAGSVLCSA